MKTKIYYGMDTMCGWCYGFSDVINKVYEKYKDTYDFHILPAGMWIDENAMKMDNKLGEYIKKHNKRIEELTGKNFGRGFNENILQGNNNVILDSLPGAKALVLIQKLNKKISFSFLKKIQEAFFVDGKDMNNLKIYSEIAQSFNISKEEFEKEFLSENLTSETKKYFESTRKLGIDTYPTLALEKGNNAIILAKGYASFEELDKLLSSYK